VEPIDWKALSDNCAGDEGLVDEVVQLFKTEGPALFADVRGAVDRGEGAEIKRTAHRLKGALLSLAATTAAGLATELEAAGVANDRSRASTLAGRLDDELRRVLAALDGR
jgi:HPt (histidine-containing phosphotransfer) domain-containing protein